MRGKKVDTALRLYEEGQGSIEIGKVVGVSKKTVEAWVDRYLHSHCSSCGTRLRRPSSTSECGLCSGVEVPA